MHLWRLLLVLLGLALALPVGALERVSLQLKWTHAFQFAGYYAAQAQGYYREAGLEVDFLVADPLTHPVTEVLAGRAQFGVGSSSLLLERGAGKPVVVLATVMQHSPQVLITGPDHYLKSLHDLAGRPIMLEPQSEELIAMLRRLRVSYEARQFTGHSQSVHDLIEGRVAAMSGYSTYEPYELNESGVHYRMFKPRAAGIDFYGDNLFTSEQLLRSQPQLVDAFRAASMRGWLYALQSPQELIDVILRDYAPMLNRDFLEYEAGKISELVHAELVQVGHMQPQRWRQIADTYADLGLLPAGFALEGFLYQHPDDRALWRTQRYLWLALAFIALGALAAAYVVRINVRLRQTRDELASSRSHYRMLTEQIKDVIWIFDPESQRFSYVSPQIQFQRGYTAQEVMDMPGEQAFAPESWAQIQAGMAVALEQFRASKALVSDYQTTEAELMCKDGSTLWTEGISRLQRHPRSGKIEIYGISRDISDRRQQEAHTRHQAQHDSLTGLPNRSLLHERLQVELTQAQAQQRGLALIFLDLDHFKPVNDNFGHAMGDKLLQAAAQRMRHSLRDSDLVARVGGDEFVVLLPQTPDSAGALRIAEKLRQSLAEPFFIDGEQLRISASLGVALFPEHGEDDATLLHHADKALYASKNDGRNLVTLYQADLESRI